MSTISLPGRVLTRDGSYEAVVENLDLAGIGTSVEAAQNDLVEQFINWIQQCEGMGVLEEKLADAGFEGVDERTELVLEFVDEDNLHIGNL